METIANDAKSLTEFLEAITEYDIQNCCGSKIFNRGEEYYLDGRVKNVYFDGNKTHLTATVSGSKKYNVEIGLNYGELIISCSCPYDSICKHVIALLIYAQNEEDIEVFEKDSSTGKNSDRVIEGHLQSLSKEELIKLVIKFAPENYLIAIRNRNSGSDHAVNKFKKIKKNIEGLFEDDDLLYDPESFAEALDKEIEKLTGLEPMLKNKGGDFILYIIDKILSLFDDGYLYIDNYDSGEEFYECSQTMEDFIVRYLQSLSFTERIDFLARLDTVLKEASYDTFETLKYIQQAIFDEKDKPAIKELLLFNYLTMPSTLVEDYYKLVKEQLSEEENERVLLKLKDYSDEYLLKLAAIYKSTNRIKAGILLIREHLKNYSQGIGNDDVYITYLDLLNIEGEELFEASKEAIKRCPNSEMLKKIASFLPEHAIHEKILEQQNPGQLVDFLESSSRLVEAQALINSNNGIWRQQVYHFYKKHKKQFPEKATEYFTKIIDDHLRSTGDNHYHAIADALREIKQVDIEYASMLCADIKNNYNRRRSLMALIARI